MKPLNLATTVLALLAFSPLAKANPLLPTADETCSRLEEMLVETQAEQPRMEDIEFALIDRELKRTWKELCSQPASADTGITARYSGGARLYENGRWYLPNGAEFTERLFQAAASNARILGPFLAAHRECAPGCGYVSWGIWGDKSHQQRRSCHNSGEAIDIHAITCRGSTYKSLSARFDSYVSCMRGSLGVIYRSKNHFDHAHFQLHGCNMCQGQGCGG